MLEIYTDDGYYSDWSYLFNPITVTGSSPGTTVDDYQAYQGNGGLIRIQG